MINRKVLIGAVITVFIILGVHLYLSANSLFLKTDEIILNLHENYDYKENISFVYLGNKEDVTINKKIDTSKIQEYKVIYSYKNNKKECKVTVTDKEPPILKLKNYKTDTVEEVTPDLFVESCKDFSEYTLYFETDDLMKIGKNKITIKAVDKFGNESKDTCILERIEDNEKPIISDVQEYIEVIQGSSFDFTNVKVEDNLDTNPQLTINGDIDFATPGQYIINYTAVDRTGNIESIESTVVVLQNEENNTKVVYLTFDDGPSYNTPKVLDVLERYGVKATFFVTGTGPAYNDYILQAYQAGHSIGLHTFSHDYSYVYSSINAYYDDLNSVGHMVENLIGYFPNIIRFPGGASNTVSANYTPGIMSELTQSVIANGYQYYDWNVSSSDASGFGVPTETIIQSASSGTGDKLMILFHDANGKDTTVEALPSIIEHYKNQGYVFLPIKKETSYVCHHGVNN